MSNSSAAPAPQRKEPFFIRPLLYLVAGGAIVWVGITGMQAWRETNAAAREKATAPSIYGLGNGEHKTLNPQFTSSNGLTAAVPTDPAKLDDPTVLSIAYDESDQDGAVKIPWDELARQISVATGKKTATHEFDANRSQIDEIHEGHYQILVVRAAEAPYLVNNIGLVPFAVAGDEQGPDGHRLNVIVNADSPIKDVQGIRGQVLECSSPRSITGYRAALAYLTQNDSMKAGVDYQIIFSGTPAQSIRDIAGGATAAAAVSNDKLISMTDSGEISPKSYRVIYESEVIPRFVVGLMYNLKPETAEQVRKTFLSFVSTPARDAGAKPKGANRTIRFVPIDYGKDFTMVRAMDDAFESRAAQAPAKPAATMPAATGPAI